MCKDCWDEAGRPTALPASAGEFIEWYEDLYCWCPTGGPLHAELDDWNLDGHIEPHPGLGPFTDPYDGQDDTEHVYAVCDRIAELLNAMTMPERYASVAAAEGFFTEIASRSGELPPPSPPG